MSNGPIDEIVVKCDNCGLPLMEIILSQTNEERIKKNKMPLSVRYQVYDCPKCEKNSVKTKRLDGTCSIMPANKQFDLEPDGYSCVDDVLEMQIKIIKR